MASIDPNFAAIVKQLMSPQNVERQEAEDLFNQSKKQPELCVGNLVSILRSSPEAESRALCAVLLRKVLTKDDPSLWPLLPPHIQNLVKQELLNSIMEETMRSILIKVSDAVAELAAGIVEEGGWPELLPFMFQCVQSNITLRMECALLIFAQLAHYIMDTLRQYMGTLHTTLGQCLGSPQQDVSVAAMRAVTSFIQALDDQAERAKFQAFIPGMLSVLATTLNHGEETAAQDFLEMFIEIAETQPRFLRRNLQEISDAMLQVAGAPGLDESTRQLAAEFLVTLCEAREKAPGMMRKLPDFPARLFTVLLDFLLDITDAEMWHSAESEATENEGEGPLYEGGQECLDRISLSLGGNTIVPLASKILPTWIVDPDWRKRHAALICLAQIAEGCIKVMQGQLDGLVDMCMLGLQDPNAKVRWAACQALGQMCTDLGPDIQTAKHQLIIPGLMSVMDDFSQPRVQAHASAAIVNFSENCEQDVVVPYLDNLIAKLLALLQHGQRMVQEGALTAMASIADCAKQSFIRYYDQVMPLLRQILTHATDQTHWLLRAKALECISLVGMAIGRERFRDDAHKVLIYMQQLQAGGLAPEDPTGGYMLQAGARLCKCLGEEFLPYLSVVMPPLLHSAQLRPDVNVSRADADSDGDDDNESDDEVETIYLGDKKISIHTTILEEKATACNMLCCYAGELNAGFYPYVEQVTAVMVPLLKFYFHEEVRQAAMQSLSPLLRCAHMAAKSGKHPGADMMFVKRMLDYIWQPLMDAMAKEPDTDCLNSMLEAVEDIVNLLGPQLLSLEQISFVFERLAGVLDDSSTRRAERLKRQHAEDFDEEEAEALQEENEDEEELLDGLAACLTAILRSYGDTVLPMMDALMPKLGALLDPSRSSEERRVGICIVDDILEHAPACSQKYMAQLVDVLLKGCQETDTNLRQCSVYGLGVLAQHRPEAFQSIAPTALRLIVDMVSQPDAKSEELGNVTDNAASSLGKVLEFHPNLGDAALADSWLRTLPLTHDTVEARIVHDQLLRFVEKSDARILGNGNANLASIVVIFGQILARGNELVDNDVSIRMAVLLQQMHASLPPEVLADLSNKISRLKPKEQAVLQSLRQGPR